jgi:hypothetical protein
MVRMHGRLYIWIVQMVLSAFFVDEELRGEGDLKVEPMRSEG